MSQFISIFSLYYLSIYLSISVCSHLSIYLSISVFSYLSIYLPISVFSYLSIYLSISPSLFISINHLSIYLSIYFQIYINIYTCLYECIKGWKKWESKRKKELPRRLGLENIPTVSLQKAKTSPLTSVLGGGVIAPNRVLSLGQIELFDI